MHRFVLFWIAAKDAVVAATGLSRDGLHVAIGLALFALLLAVAGPRRSGRCWLALFAVELVNELVDQVTSLTLTGDTCLADSLSDMVLTLTLPTLACSWLLALAMWFPQESRRATRRSRLRPA